MGAAGWGLGANAGTWELGPRAGACELGADARELGAGAISIGMTEVSLESGSIWDVAVGRHALQVPSDSKDLAQVHFPSQGGCFVVPRQIATASWSQNRPHLQSLSTVCAVRFHIGVRVMLWSPCFHTFSKLETEFGLHVDYFVLCVLHLLFEHIFGLLDFQNCSECREPQTSECYVFPERKPTVS